MRAKIRIPAPFLYSIGCGGRGLHFNETAGEATVRTTQRPPWPWPPLPLVARGAGPSSVLTCPSSAVLSQGEKDVFLF